MPKIFVGEGSAQAVLEVSQVPKDGDRLTIQEDHILEVATDSAYLMVGDTFVFTQTGNIEVGGKKVPWFGLQNVKFLQERRPTPGKGL